MLFASWKTEFRHGGGSAAAAGEKLGCKSQCKNLIKMTY
jgi:hypothetical protein